MLDFVLSITSVFVQSSFFSWWFPYLFAIAVLFFVVKVVFTIVQFN